MNDSLVRRGMTRPLFLALICVNAAVGMALFAARPDSAPGADAQASATPVARRPVYHSPWATVFSPDGRMVAVSDRSAGVLAILNPADGKIDRRTTLSGRAGGVAFSADGNRVYVAEYDGGTVAEVSAADGAIAGRITVGARPMGLALAPKRGLLLVANSVSGDVSLIDASSRKERARVSAVREPFWIAVTPDESLAVVTNLLPGGAATDPGITAAVSLIDLEKLQRATDIPLPPNSTCVRQAVISPDGRWAYVVHTVGRSNLPATQLDRGWVNTNALSLIDLAARRHHATLLLDSLSEGAADPWGLALSPDGRTLWVTLSGTHQLARIDAAGLHELLEGKSPKFQGAKTPVPGPAYASAIIWDEIKADPAKRAQLVNDLSALHVGGVIERRSLPGNGPRGIAISPDGKRLAIAMYYGGEVVLADASDGGRIVERASLGEQPVPDEARRGEIIFHDARYTFQKWLSCATCHPNEGRVDGLNWDLPNDGLGNPKNNKSLLQAHMTAPSTWLGVREGFEQATEAGFRFAQQAASPVDVQAVQAYLRSLAPEPSPRRQPDGSLSPRALRGKTVFESDAAGCAKCHAGPQYTDRKRYDVGTSGALDHPGETYFDTPTLVELWRTAPYLHDGRAATVRDVLTKHNARGEHGRTSQLSPQQIDDLVEYLLSLP